MTVIDYICIAVLLLFVVVAAIRGFAKVILRMLAVMGAAVLSRLAAAPLSDLIYAQVLHTPIQHKLYELFPSGSIGGSLDSILGALESSLPEPVYNIASFLHMLPEGSLLGDSFYTVQTIEQTYVQPIITKVLLIITSIVLFAVLSIIFGLIVSFIDKQIIKKRKGAVKTVNRILGGVIGLVQGIIPVGVGCMLLNVVAPVTENTQFADLVSHSYFCNLIAGIF